MRKLTKCAKDMKVFCPYCDEELDPDYIKGHMEYDCPYLNQEKMGDPVIQEFLITLNELIVGGQKSLDRLNVTIAKAQNTVERLRELLNDES